MIEDVPPSEIWTGLTAILCVVIVHIVMPLIFATVAMWRSKRLVRRANATDAATLPSTPLVEGEAVTIHGVVEFAPGSNMALRVEIDQGGVDRVAKNVVQHVWKEIDRRIVIAPFYVHDERGGVGVGDAGGRTRIRVEPDQRTQLGHSFDQTVRKQRFLRMKVAELAAGEVVYVVGDLTRDRDPTAGTGYRGTESSLVMKRPRVVSTKPFGDRFREDSAMPRRASRLITGLMILFAFVDIGFYVRLVTGHAEIGTLESMSITGYKNPRCMLVVKRDEAPASTPADEQRVEVETDKELCGHPRDQLTPGSSKIPVFYAGKTFSHAGTSAGVHLGAILGGGFFFLFIFLLGFTRSKEWWERKMVDQGNGPLL